MATDTIQFSILMAMIFALAYISRKTYVFVTKGTFDRSCSVLEFISLMALSVVLSSALGKLL
ncbi:hypothetical protein KJY73_02520 [Bowmanella sp. Y26]|uniref:hypothetical protein n=1 Tax=Bowmanella yangjiangensis TaxID=2811230 RepID=UPI001BDDC8D5|nr:hypothetical protein [Bowmanella yangjiangensis]MBT1062426.1 hypothetical protein [Bowmanella yangjiangensis]